MVSELRYNSMVLSLQRIENIKWKIIKINKDRKLELIEFAIGHTGVIKDGYGKVLHHEFRPVVYIESDKGVGYYIDLRYFFFHHPTVFKNPLLEKMWNRNQLWREKYKRRRIIKKHNFKDLVSITIRKAGSPQEYRIRLYKNYPYK